MALEMELEGKNKQIYIYIYIYICIERDKRVPLHGFPYKEHMRPSLNTLLLSPWEKSAKDGNKGAAPPAHRL